MAQQFYISDSQVAAVANQLFTQGGVIAAIKELRAHSGLGLKEAKDTIDAVRARAGMIAGQQHGNVTHGRDSLAQMITDEMNSRWNTKTWDNSSSSEKLFWGGGDVENLLARTTPPVPPPTHVIDTDKVATFGADTTLRMLDMLAALVKEQRETNNLLKDLLSVMED